ncbi:C6 transcription factor [Thelonectria olida]|uniref:C6 transcription factor n=1 Tax=Thelonectria olida TaxID=1576542 RepID=A0A9P8W4I4_9HYPO|nr:C6 transcription factor [Thelonectria olida]
MDKTPESLSEPAFRTRRAHKKSRAGCVSCKKGRKKCDELKPRCSRCMTRNLTCEYSNKPVSIRLSPSPSPSSRLKPAPTPSPTYSSPIDTSPGCLSPSSSLSPVSNEHHHLPLAIGSEFLGPTELHLLSHYLTHTARTIAYDNDDLYALQVGFPNIAFRSRPLMSSILALAAVCKCHDIITESDSQATPTPQDQAQIRDLLLLGDKHHRASLRQTQADIPHTDYYDHVLANAPLMVLYGTASHCVRIRLAQSMAGTGSESLMSDCAPGQSQWISLIRATHLAYTGLLNAQPEFPDTMRERSPAPPAISLPLFAPQSPDGNDIISPEDGPTRETRRLLLPILETTSASALERLGSKAQIAYLSQSCRSAELESCFVALEILRNIVDDVFNTHPESSTTAGLQAPDTDFHLISQLSEVSPWLRSYLARVTSATRPKPLRRIITSFLNRVPTEYLNLAQTTLDLIPVHAGPYEDNGPGEAAEFGLPQDGPAARLAMDIFAHWLVLVMLLDGVWWIGGTGAWELERVVGFMHRRGWVETQEGSRGSWWPESMHKVVTEAKKYI